MQMTAERKAGIAYLVPFGAVAAIWYTLLFVSNPPGHGPEHFLKYALLEDPDRVFFWWLAAVPLICLLLAAAYLSAIAAAKVGAVAALAVGAVVAVASWLTLDWAIALFVTVPLLFTVPRTAWHLTNRSSRP